MLHTKLGILGFLTRWNKSLVAFVLVGLLIVVTAAAAQAHSRSSATSEWLQRAVWETHSQSVILKDKEIRFSFAYPRGWHIEAKPDSFQVTVQNVAPFNNPAEVPGGLAEGFVKIGFMLDPKADPRSLRPGGKATLINNLPWQQWDEMGELAGDYSRTLETIHEGVVFRIYTYIARTGGRGPAFDRYDAALGQMINSLKIEPALPLDRPPDAPPLPPDGKSKTP